MNNFRNLVLIEYLKAMGHSDIQCLPADKLCDIYLPKSNVGIISNTRNYTSIITNNELNSTGKFIQDTLTKQGANVVVLFNSTMLDLISKESNEGVSTLQSLSNL
jgi:hypothetical protein